MKLTYNKQIGKLNRTLDLIIFDWGVMAVVKDITEGSENFPHFDARNFRITGRYPSVADNEVRALKYYKMEDAILVN